MLSLKLGEILVKMRVAESVRVADGEMVPVAFDTGSIHLFDAESGLRVGAVQTDPARERGTPARAPAIDE